MRSYIRHGGIYQEGRPPWLTSKTLLQLSLLVNVLALVALVSFVLSSPSLRSVPVQWNGGHPVAPQTGTCYCNADEYCLCSPNLAIDLVIVSGSDHVWLVRRRDTNQLSTMGGFVQVGETVEDAVRRELLEETGIVLREAPILFGVYSDPRRDRRRHTVSVTYAVHLDGSERPRAADDVKEVTRIPMDEIERHEYFADHRTILLDYRKILRDRSSGMAVGQSPSSGDFASDIVRSTCPNGVDLRTPM